MSTSRKPWLRLVAFCVGLHIACTPVLADEIPLFNCLEQPQPADASQLRAMAASVGSSSDIGNLTVIEFGGEYDRDLAVAMDVCRATSTWPPCRAILF